MAGSNRKSAQVEYDLEEMRALVRPGGGLSTVLPGFCHRQEQEDLMVRIAEALAGDEFLLAEAGTGVGKSLAYLIPAVFWAVSTGERVVVSTRTKALQDQLVNVDLPLLARVLPFGFIYEQAKGRENYLCRQKLANLVARGGDLTIEQKEFLQRVAVWAVQTRTGDRQELRIDSHLLSNWRMVACDRRACLRERCSFQESCFRHRLISRLGQANLIVVNHSLLLADVRVERGILPEYRYLIMDEAHNLEREAFDKFGISFSLPEIRDVLNTLAFKQRRVQTGYLAMLQNRYSHLQPGLTEIRELKEACLQEVENFFACLSERLPPGAGESSQTVRWPGQHAGEEGVLDAFNIVQGSFNTLLGALRKLQQELQDSPEALELEALILRLQEAVMDASIIMTGNLDDPEQVVWVDYNYGRAMAVNSSPLKVGQMIDKCLYQKLNSLVMVSATLTVAGDYSHFIERSGLHPYLQDRRLATITRPSPFDYNRCCQIYLVNDLPDPNHRSFQPMVSDFLSDFLPTIPGRTLVLFTSRRMMQEAARELRPILTGEGITLLVQHEDGDFSTLVDQMVASSRAVLMGLDTFWEGVDLRGDYLTCLVIVKMPFRSPSDPLVSAWNDHYRVNGENGFSKFMLPDAVLRFKQGVGRLIRSESDWGAAVILDGRLAVPPRGKNYGQVFVQSLPTKITALGWSEAGKAVATWLESFV